MEPIALSIDELLTTTRTVRKRLDLERPVERKTIEACLDLGFQAPNGSNNQSWEWVIVDDPAKRAQIADLNRAALAHFTEILERTPAGMSAYDVGRNERMESISTSVYHLIEHLHEVPVLVLPLISGRTENLNTFYQASLWGSVLPAVWNFMLALRSRGHGSAWTTLHLWKEREVAEVLGIPHEKYTQAGLFPVAYTVGIDFKPAQRVSARELIRWNGW
jgi:nitroreductase